MKVLSRVQQRKFKSAVEEALVSLLVVAGQLNQRLEDLCRRHGITHDQYNVLRILRGAGSAGHPRYEIANRLMSRAPDVTRLVDRLARQGLVERGWAPENRRLSIARITSAGIDLLAAIDPELQALEREMTDGLSVEELRALSRTCDRMVR